VSPARQEEVRVIAVSTGRYKIGQVVATPGVVAALERTGQSPWEFVSRHIVGDWGIVDGQDKAANDQAVVDGSRILSAYLLGDGQTKVWVITEAEDDHGRRAATTLLLPDEY
jgi:hypothetical protein